MLAIDKINRKLREKGMSGQDIARALGLSNSAYSNWNTGKTKISGKNLKRIAEEVFHCPVEEIMDDPEVPENEKTAAQTGDGVEEQKIRLLRAFDQMTVDQQTRLVLLSESLVSARTALDGLVKFE